MTIDDPPRSPAIDTESYRVTAQGRPLDLTFKEFELLRFLASRAGRVFTRPALLREVWGYDFYGGTRTVDVHVRRLRIEDPERRRRYGEAALQRRGATRSRRSGRAGTRCSAR